MASMNYVLTVFYTCRIQRKFAFDMKLASMTLFFLRLVYILSLLELTELIDPIVTRN
jgi:hypothetical protein